MVFKSHAANITHRNKRYYMLDSKDKTKVFCELKNGLQFSQWASEN